MTEVLVGLIAVLPALLGYLNSRKRQLATIEAEISVYAALPKSDKTSRKAMRAEIANSVAHYHGRRARRTDVVFTFGWSIAWLFMVLGYNLYNNSLTDPDTIETFRHTAGLSLVVAGAIILVANLTIGAVRSYLLVRLWWMGRRVKKLEKEVADKEARVEALKPEVLQAKKEVEEALAKALDNERRAIESGQEPKPRPAMFAEMYEVYEATGSLDDYEPSAELIARVRQASGDSSPDADTERDT
jgi:hypothetical protein